MKAKRSKPKTHTLRIVAKKRSFKVVPGRRHVRWGDTVVWRTKATAVRLMFPNMGLFGRGRLDIRRRGSARLKVRRIDSGVYPYAAWCRTNNDFAAGGSAPKMIVD